LLPVIIELTDLSADMRLRQSVVGVLPIARFMMSIVSTYSCRSVVFVVPMARVSMPSAFGCPRRTIVVSCRTAPVDGELRNHRLRCCAVHVDLDVWLFTRSTTISGAVRGAGCGMAPPDCKPAHANLDALTM